MNKLFKKLTNIELYKVIFMICSLLYVLPGVNVIGSIMLKVMLIWGGVLLIERFYHKKIYIDNKYFFLFLIFTLLSIVINFQYGFIRNIKDFLYLILEILLFTQTDRNYQNGLLCFNRFLLWCMAFVFTASLLIFFLQISIVPGFEKYTMSFVDGRLWGWCGNPNTLANMCLYSIFAVIINWYLNKESISRWKITGYCFVIIEAISCLALSQSRSGFVGFFILIAGIVFFVIYKNKNILITILISGCLGVFSLFALQLYGEGLRYLPKELVTVEENNIVLENREVGEDYSNGRFTIWKGGLQVAKNNLFFGVGQSVLNAEVNKELPSDYVKRAPGISSNMHNIYLQILTTSGLFALIFFIIQFISSYWKRRAIIFIDTIKYILFLVTGSMLVMNLFDSNIIGFMNLFFACLFWIYFGYFISDNPTGKKNVLFLINSLKIGGAETVLRDIVHHFDYQEFNVSVRTLFSEGELLSDFSKPIHYSALIRRPNRLKKAIIWRCVKYLPRVIIQYFICGQYDFIIAFLEGMPCKIVGSLKNNDCKKYGWIHTDLVNNPDSETNYRSRKQALECYKNMDKIICVSNDCKEKFLLIYPELKEQTLVIYNCLDIERIRKLANESVQLPYTKKNEKLLLCSVGRLAEEKGFLRMLHVIKRLKEEGTQIQWMLIGDGEERVTLENFVKNNDLNENVFFMGYQKNPFVYMKKSDYYVCSSSVEGFSLTVVEALIVGLPVISTRCTGPSEILSDNCGILCENSEDGLYLALKSLNENSNQLSREKIDERINQFSIETILNKIYELIGG